MKSIRNLRIQEKRKGENTSDIAYQPEMKLDVQEEDPLFGRYPNMSMIKLTIINIRIELFFLSFSK
jgi:hypothetical protein